MLKLARRIQARAVRRAGQLLAQIPSGTGSALPNVNREGALPLVTRTQAADDAGLSERQRKTALRVAREHELARSCAESAVQHAVRCGELLIEQKAQLQHGEFGQWVQQHAPFSYATARVYMKAADQNARGLAFSSLMQLFPSGRPERAAASESTREEGPPMRSAAGSDLDDAT